LPDNGLSTEVETCSEQQTDVNAAVTGGVYVLSAVQMLFLLTLWPNISTLPRFQKI